MMTFVFSALATTMLLASEAPAPNEPERFNVLGERTLFQPPLAHPRSPEFALVVILNAGSDRVTGVMGSRIPFLNLHQGDLHLQLGFDAGVWTDLRMVTNVFGFPLTAVDYLFGLPLMASYGPFSAVLELSHISAHLGDGVLTPRDPIKYTREFARLLVAWAVTTHQVALRVYGGGQVLLHTVPEVPRGSGELGVEARLERWAAVQPYAAVTGMYQGDTGTFDVGSQLGVYLATASARSFSFRVALAGYWGSDRRGQFLGDALSRITAGVYGRY
ncbi:MAG: DUF1207 domain-containing protein [Myxococcus sp.]|nr:DUF1207 domain-containing protein [Myxococcus sp.]